MSRRDICGREIEEESQRNFSTTPAWAQAIIDALGRIEDRLTMLPQVRRHPPADADALAPILQAISGAFGSTPFAVADLTGPVFQAVLGSYTGRKLGKLLARHADQDIGGLVVSRAGREHSGVLWQVSKLVKLPDTLPLPK